MRQPILVQVLTITAILLTASAQAADPKPWTASLTTTVGAQLDSTNSQSSVTLEPDLLYKPSETSTLELYSAVDRPFNVYENLTVPKTLLGYSQRLHLLETWDTSAGASVTALNLHRWTRDGHQLRGALSGTLGKTLAPGLKVAFKAGPFVQSNGYTQAASGATLPKWGFAEKLSLQYQVGRLTVDLAILADQRMAAVWKNGYGTVEQVEYQLTDQWSLGLAHELLGSVVDDSTGLFAPLQVFDERNSRVSAFVAVQL